MLFDFFPYFCYFSIRLVPCWLFVWAWSCFSSFFLLFFLINLLYVYVVCILFIALLFSFLLWFVYMYFPFISAWNGLSFFVVFILDKNLKYDTVSFCYSFQYICVSVQIFYLNSFILFLRLFFTIFSFCCTTVGCIFYSSFFFACELNGMEHKTMEYLLLKAWKRFFFIPFAVSCCTGSRSNDFSYIHVSAWMLCTYSVYKCGMFVSHTPYMIFSFNAKGRQLLLLL